jgi:hypothetical protein
LPHFTSKIAKFHGSPFGAANFPFENGHPKQLMPFLLIDSYQYGIDCLNRQQPFTEGKFAVARAL